MSQSVDRDDLAVQGIPRRCDTANMSLVSVLNICLPRGTRSGHIRETERRSGRERYRTNVATIHNNDLQFETIANRPRRRIAPYAPPFRPDHTRRMSAKARDWK